MKNTKYCGIQVSNQQAVTGFLTATPAAISTISAYNTIECLIQCDQTIWAWIGLLLSL
jgi:hypothetical protein